MKAGPVFFLLAAAVFLAGVGIDLAEPIAEWDYVCLDAASAWAQGLNVPWVFDHPPLYPAALAVVFRAFGASVVAARLMNAVFLLLTAWLVRRSTRYFSSRPGAGWWAAGLFLLSPLTIQGAGSMDMADTTLLPLTLMLSVLWVARLKQGKVSGAEQALGIGVVALLCWAKATSALVWLAGLGGAMYLYRRQLPKPWRAVLTWAALGGVALFVLSWLLLSLSLWGPESAATLFSSPWQSLKDNLIRPEGIAARVVRLVMDGIRLLLWMGPWVLALAVWRGLRRPATDRPLTAVIGWAAAGYALLYWLLRGTSWSFPRYHAAIMPVIALLAGPVLQQMLGRVTGRQWQTLGTAAGILLFGLLALDDPLLFPSLGWKEAVLFGSLPSAAGRWLAHASLFVIAPLLVGWLSRQRGVAVAWAAFVSLVALDFMQAAATYRTSYQYGAQGKQEVVALVAEVLQPGEAVLATPEFLHEWQAYDVPRYSLGFWQHAQAVDWRRELAAQRPRAIVFGLTTQTLGQWQMWLRDAPLQQMLAQHYAMQVVGTYRLWLRRAGAADA